MYYCFPRPPAKTPALKPFGTGVTTPREIAALLEKIERGQIVNAAACKEMISLMKREQHRHGIGRAISDTEMATKAGELDRLRSDVGIIYTKQGRIVMASTCDDMPDISDAGRHFISLRAYRLANQP